MVVYKITNKLNNKVYVGQTSRTMKERIKDHKKSNNSLIGKDIRQFGIDNFSIEILEEVSTREEAYRKEIEWIAKCDCLIPKGYNQCKGGKATDGYKYSEEVRHQMSVSRKGKYVGENNPFYGKHHSEEQRKKWSEQRRGRKLTEEWKRKVGLASMRKVRNVDTGEVFNSIKEACEKYNLKDTHISRVCRGGRKTTGGYRWEYYSE